MSYLFLGDCLEGLKKLPSKQIELCFTSPPYNLDINYSTYNDHKPYDQYLGWMNEVFGELSRILTDDGHFFLNMGYSNISPWVGMDVAMKAREHFVLQNNFTWVKSIAIDDTQIGHYKPINSDRYANPTWEHVFHFTKSGRVLCDRESVGVPYADKTNIDKTGRIKGRVAKKMGFRDIREFMRDATDEQRRQFDQLVEERISKQKPLRDNHCAGNVWYVPYETITSTDKHRGKHPATFPIALVEKAILFSGVHSGTLIDPFMGTGTAAVAAQNRGLEYLGFEIDEQYHQYSINRLENIE